MGQPGGSGSTFLLWSLLFTSAAILVAGYLLWATTVEGGGLAGCGEGSGCDDVLGSRWSLWLGLPVSMFALGFYLLLAGGILFLYPPRKRNANRLPWLVPVALAGGIVICWFVLLQAAVIRSFCVYCLADHVLGLLAVGFLLLHARKAAGRLPPAGGIVALVLAAVFVVVHVLAEPSRVDVVKLQDIEDRPGQPNVEPVLIGPAGSPPVHGVAARDIQDPPGQEYAEPVAMGPEKPTRIVGVLGGRVSFDLYAMPHLGNREAEHVILELFDYTCSHCRDLHQHIHLSLERYGGQLAVVTLPVPLEKPCNPFIQNNNPKHRNACEYARLSMAICASDPRRFPAFHDWLMAGKNPPPLEQVQARAETIVGEGALDKALSHPRVAEWLNDGITMYKHSNTGSIPKLAVGDQVVNIPHTTSRRLFTFLESKLGIKPEKKQE